MGLPNSCHNLKRLKGLRARPVCRGGNAFYAHLGHLWLAIAIFGSLGSVGLGRHVGHVAIPTKTPHCVQLYPGNMAHSHDFISVMFLLDVCPTWTRGVA
jgi:hypothetical protein